MEANLESILEKLDYEQLNIVQISDMLEGKYDLPLINQTLINMRKKKESTNPNPFGNCGIDPDANPCGDACEY